MNTSRSINSTSSITTNLFDTNEDENLDLFNSSDNSIQQMKHRIADELKMSFESKSISLRSVSNSPVHKLNHSDIRVKSSKDHDDDDTCSDRTDSLAEKLGLTLSSNEFIRIEPIGDQNQKDKKSQSNKTAIYDNNLTSDLIPNKSQDYEKNKLNLLSSNDSSMSKSYDRIDQIKFKTSLNSNQNPKVIYYKNRVSYIEQDSANAESQNSSNLNKVGYSKSLKFLEKTNTSTNRTKLENLLFEAAKIQIDLNNGQDVGNRQQSNNDNYKVISNKNGTKEFSFSSRFNSEPSWKELAFKKQNAWYFGIFIKIKFFFS